MINIKKFFKDIYNKGNFKDYFNRNKLFLIIAICLLILSVYTGINHTVVNNTIINYITGPIQSVYVMTDNPLSTFIQNLTYSLYTIMMGLSLSILSILIVVSHGVKMGNALNFNNFLHVINDVFVLVGSFLLCKMELRFIRVIISGDLKNVFANIKVPLKDLILTLTFILIFVLIMSFI